MISHKNYFILVFLLLTFTVSGCSLNPIRITQIHYMTPHGNELSYVDPDESDGDPDKILLFVTLSNPTALPVIPPKLRMKFWMAVSTKIQSAENAGRFDDGKTQSQDKWVKLVETNVINIKIFKPHETRKILIDKIPVGEFRQETLSGSEIPTGYRTIVFCGGSKREKNIDIISNM